MRPIMSLTRRLEAFAVSHVTPESTLWKALRRVKHVLPREEDLHYVGSQRIINRFSRRKRNVFFVQVGACDGMTLDPLRHFILRDGWRGIFVEPVPYVFERLVRNYKGRPGLVFEKGAISTDDQPRDLHYLRQSEDTLPVFYDQLGSFLPEVVLKHQDRITDIRERLVTERVSCMTLQGLLDKHRVEALDVLHTDTEGFDFEIIKQLDFQRVRPSLILYEHKHLSAGDRAACLKMLRAQRYSILEEEHDTLAYVRWFRDE